MKLRAPLSTALALGFIGVVTLGSDDCEGEGIRHILRTLADHEERITALEDKCVDECVCDQVFEPVCGEDGNTYANACEAKCADVEIAGPGPCRDFDCGGDEGIACEEGQFCEIRPGSCDAMAPGICVEIPETCTDVFTPVCGCDGETYANDCERRAAGVPLDHRGECGSIPDECESNDGCMEDEYCQKRKGVCDDGVGACMDRPIACPLDFDPVCGCDGETYSNDCAAAAAGVSIADRGECRPPPVVCADNSECGEDEFCRKRIGQCEAEGICAPRPAICPLFFDPVCGCDGETYDNECQSYGAGESLADDRACESDGHRVAVCHIPPGNPDNRHTIFVGESAVRAHLDHGDFMGFCKDARPHDDWDREKSDSK